MATESLKKNKAPGFDGIPPIVFKCFNIQLVKCMTFLFNKLLEEVYSDSWSTGLIKPIYKRE